MVKIISHRNEFYQRLNKAFDETVTAYENKLIAVFNSPRKWPDGFGVTRRKNGELVVGSFRNIVDTANLRNSQSVERRPLSATFSWTGKGVTPPVLIHEGARLRNGRRLPPRRFTRVAANEVNLPITFVEALRRAN